MEKIIYDLIKKKYSRSFKSSSLFVIFLIFIGLSGCDKSDSENPITPPAAPNENAVTIFSSTNGGTVSVASGYSMIITPGTVPKQTSGAPGRVSFSIEVGVNAPVAPPYPVVGKIVKFGPENYNFAYPVKMIFPGGSEASSAGLKVYHYYEDLGQWRRVTISSMDSTRKALGADSPKLGLYALVKTPESADFSQTSEGGIVYGSSSNNSDCFTLTVMSALLTYPDQENNYYGGLNGYTFSSGSVAGGGASINPVFGSLPQGIYEFRISRATYSGSTLGPLYTNSAIVTVDINSSLMYLGWGNAYGYINVPVPSGTWNPGAPSNWPPPTIPYGTGIFQATLNWTNTQSSAVDVDLWLYIPGDSIYFGHTHDAGGFFELDRDWQSLAGNATENIYSLLTEMPAGAYAVKVKYFNGNVPSKDFNVRIILNGTVTTYSGTVSSTDRVKTILTFTK